MRQYSLRVVHSRLSRAFSGAWLMLAAVVGLCSGCSAVTAPRSVDTVAVDSASSSSTPAPSTLTRSTQSAPASALVGKQQFVDSTAQLSLEEKHGAAGIRLYGIPQEFITAADQLDKDQHDKDWHDKDRQRDAEALPAATRKPVAAFGQLTETPMFAYRNPPIENAAANVDTAVRPEPQPEAAASKRVPANPVPAPAPAQPLLASSDEQPQRLEPQPLKPQRLESQRAQTEALQAAKLEPAALRTRQQKTPTTGQERAPPTAFERRPPPAKYTIQQNKKRSELLADDVYALAILIGAVLLFAGAGIFALVRRRV